MPDEEPFEIRMRGYDKPAVDEVVAAVRSALERGDPALVAEALRRIDEAQFDSVMRGYARDHVDQYLAWAGAELRKAQQA